MAYDKLVDSAKLDATFKGIADAIRRNQNATEPIHIDRMPIRINEVHQDGYMKGFEEGKNSAEQDGYNNGLTEGVAIGKQLEYDRFWDAYQQNGSRDNYQYAFSGCWDRNTFLPKYDINATTINTGFYKFNQNDANWQTFDMVEHLESLGVVFGTSQCTNFVSAFMWANIGRLGVIDCRKNTATMSNTFAYGKIKTIDKLIVKEDIVFSNTFTNQAELTNITIEGTIGNPISFQHSTKLSKESIESIIGALSDTKSGLTVTLSKTAVTNAFGSTTAEAWTNLIGTKSNWTISLV